MKKDAETIRGALARVVASPGFVSAGRLAPFLTFVVERALAAEPVKESLVGVEVFRRPADYDPRLDPIVRVEARRLRARLAEYYAGAGAHERLRIELPKGGYTPVFVLQSDDSPDDATAVPARGPARLLAPWLWPLVALAVVAAAAGAAWRIAARSAVREPMVAVLPFANLSDAPADVYFSEGLSEEIIDRLVRLPGLQVVARSASFRFRERDRDPRAVGRQLGATAILEGSVRRSGDRLRVTAQLADVLHGRQIWSRTYERQAEDVFAIQDDIARAIASALRVELRVGAFAANGAPAASVAAHDLLLAGRYHLNHDAIAGIELAADAFEKAAAADPDYAAAHAALAQTQALLAYYRLRPAATAWPQARRAAERALQLDPASAEAHAVLGQVAAIHEWKWSPAEASFRRALELGDHSAEVHVAAAWGMLLPRGRLVEALGEADRAVALDPESLLGQYLRAFVLLTLGRYTEAAEGYGRAASLSPSHGDIQWDHGMALALAGRRDEALRQFQIGGSIHSGGGWMPGPAEWALLGRPDRARAAIEGWPEFNRQRPLFVAYALGLLGEADQAAPWLERACDERDPQVIWAKVDPRLAKVRDHPRIQAVIRRVGL